MIQRVASRVMEEFGLSENALFKMKGDRLGTDLVESDRCLSKVFLIIYILIE